MQEGTKRLFPNSYNEFVSTMISAAEQGDLPVILQLDDIEDFTLKDFQDAFNDFQKDTMLNIEGHMFICSDCGRMHVVVSVDYSDEESTLIQ